MKQFDYRRAWHDAAKPAYESLPQNVRDLLALTAEASDGLNQLPDCSMPWPDDTRPYNLRARFDKIPAEWLALAAQVVYNVGHWYPADGDLEIPGRKHGAHWKFAHYADQSLRSRLGISMGDHKGTGLQVHEGAIRVFYSSLDTWTWTEVAPATQAGHDFAQAAREKIEYAISHTRAGTEARDNAARSAMEVIEADRSGFPAEWLPLIDTERYMVEESEIIQATQDPAHTARRFAAERDRLIRTTEDQIAALKINAAGMLWLMDHGLTTENAIYYSHTRRFCFGWRTTPTPEAISKWLDALTEFPYDYDIKGYDPRATKERSVKEVMS